MSFCKKRKEKDFCEHLLVSDLHLFNRTTDSNAGYNCHF